MTNKKLNRMFRVKEVSPTTFVAVYPFWLIVTFLGRDFIVILGYEYSEIVTLAEARAIRKTKRWGYIHTKRNLKLL